MSKTIQAVRGMKDILPAQMPYWQHLEDTVRQILESYAYQEIRPPLVEKTELFARSIGEVTDIVEKEMYTFVDRNGESLTLRPEGTASCVRAGIENGLLQKQTHRLWYKGPMFRHERPQKGRYRQFYQIGAEVYGMATPDIDAELIAMTARFWQQLGLNNVVLQLNSLGSTEARQHYREILVNYLSQHTLDEDSQRRLHSNPLRILDSKNPDMQAIIQNAPILLDYLDDESKAHFETVQSLLHTLNIPYEINPRLVRGLDYYNRTVFEWITTELGAQGTVCAGGRYDGLVEQIGGRATPAVGFAMGIERLIALLEQQSHTPPAKNPHIYIIMVGDNTLGYGLKLAEFLRNALPQLRVETNCGGGSFKAQFKRADKSGAQFAIILGEDEVNQHQAGLKPLREQAKEQASFSWEGLVAHLSHLGY